MCRAGKAPAQGPLFLGFFWVSYEKVITMSKAATKFRSISRNDAKTDPGAGLGVLGALARGNPFMS